MTIPDGHFEGPDESWDDDNFRQTQVLPRWRVLLHDDEVHDKAYVIDALAAHTPLSRVAATQRVVDVHHKGTTTLLTCHQELAELYCVQLSKQNLIVTIERTTD